MACVLADIKTAACESGIGRETNKIKLLQLIAQLTCEAGQGDSAAGSPSNPIVVDNINMDLDFNYAHGLGAVPSNVRLVYRVTVATGNYAVNEEIDRPSVFDFTSTSGQPTVGVSSTSTLVSLAMSGAFALSNAGVKNKIGSGIETADSSWLVGKLYIWR